jgi:hypothetical protein
MSYFLVEIPVMQSNGVDIERAARTLASAQLRLSARAIAVRLHGAGVTSDDGRLVCLIETEAVEVVRSLVALALLPAGRIREVRLLAVPGVGCGPSAGGGPDPVADLAPGRETELVQGVVDVSFHGAFGDE